VTSLALPLLQDLSDGTNNVLYLVIIALLGGVGGVMKVAHSEITRGRDRAEKQVDEVLPALKANTEAINSTVKSGSEFRGFLVELVSAIGAVAKVVSSLQDDHKRMNERLDAIERNIETCTNSCRETYERSREYADDGPQPRRSRSGT
jgi:hypothetical protein